MSGTHNTTRLSSCHLSLVALNLASLACLVTVAATYTVAVQLPFPFYFILLFEKERMYLASEHLSLYANMTMLTFTSVLKQDMLRSRPSLTAHQSRQL
jgi:hypothetical protein